MIKDFKNFIDKGNALDMAVAVIMGGAFGKIVSSLVDDLIMPLIGIISGGIDFSELSIKFGESTINYGMLIQNIIDFFIIAIVIFFMVKLFNKLEIEKVLNNDEEEKKKKKPKENKPSEEILLLREIRDSLKKD